MLAAAVVAGPRLLGCAFVHTVLSAKHLRRHVPVTKRCCRTTGDRTLEIRGRPSHLRRQPTARSEPEVGNAVVESRLSKFAHLRTERTSSRAPRHITEVSLLHFCDLAHLAEAVAETPQR